MPPIKTLILVSLNFKTFLLYLPLIMFCINIFFFLSRDTSAEVKKIAQNDTAQDVLNSNQAAVLEMD